jgi:hypothetical protein
MVEAPTPETWLFRNAFTVGGVPQPKHAGGADGTPKTTDLSDAEQATNGSRGR